ncbi:MAG TPA: AAA family ATPase [Candidatus Limnocylindrales bacterium]|nr:AAA family ATPase [Candidatus Limnocylindrales bacterium]
MSRILGRDAELAAIAAALDAAVAGPVPASRVVLVEGEAGIGKSTVWAEAIDRAARLGWRVLAARAVASESGLTLAVLADLLAEIDRSAIEALPPVQRVAVEGALLEVERSGSAIEARVLGTAVRNLLAALATAAPTLVAIDDIQWMDPASAQVVGFAVRRLGMSRIALLGGRRSGVTLPFDLGEVVPSERLTRVAIGPMSAGTLHLLLKGDREIGASRSTLVRIHHASGGNPLFALEIARLLDEVGEPPAGEPLPVPPDVRELLRRRLEKLPAPVFQVLLGTALLGQATIGRLTAADGRDVVADVGAAAREGLVRLDREIVTFSHPLYAAAVLAVAPPELRRAVHARLAATADSVDERARHRALSTVDADAEVAAELDEAATRAVARAAPSAAAELLRLAIAKTPAEDGGALASRRLALGRTLVRAGETDAARDAFASVAATGPAPLRAQANLELAVIHYDADGSTARAVELCEAAIADAVGHPALLARAQATLAAVDYEDADRKRRAVAEAARLLDLQAEPDLATQAMVVLQQCADEFLRTGRLDPGLVALGLDLDARGPNVSVAARFGAALGTWLQLGDDLAEARRWLERTLDAAEAAGDEASQPFALSHLSQVALLQGDWDGAEALARRHLDVAALLRLDGQRRMAMANLAAVAAHRGRVEAARGWIDEALEPSLESRDDWAGAALLAVLGFLELSAGRFSAAVDAFEQERAVRRRLIAFETPRRGDTGLVEALAADGRLGQASAALQAMEADARPYAWHWLRADLARANAVLLAAAGDLGAAEAALLGALAEHDAAGAPFDRGRTVLILGQVRRRLRERAAARDAFEEARITFEGLGAEGWAARARAELARTGLRRGSGPGLTEGERRVAELVASGMTNREVGAALFMSPKTVDANLGRVYAKLGIRSRAQLGAAMPRGAPGLPT